MSSYTGKNGFRCVENVCTEKAVINLFQSITEESAANFIKEFQYLESISSKIQIRVNSAGGSVLHGWSIIDIIINSSVPIEVVVVGVAASMASVIAVAATETKIMDYASIMVHNPFYASTSVVDVDDPQLKTYREQLVRL